MPERTTITVTKATKERLDSKRNGQPWDEFLKDAIQLNSPQRERGRDDALTEAHIEDIANAAARKTVDELQAVMR